MEVSEETDKRVYYHIYSNEAGSKNTLMDIVETVSALTGSAILLSLFISIAYESLVVKHNSKKNVLLALNRNWQRLTVSAH